jgi:hypothetical protein
MNTYKLRLISGREVLPPPSPGGFCLVSNHAGYGNRIIGGVRDFDMTIEYVAKGAVGGFHLTASYGDHKTSTGFIPIAQVEEIVPHVQEE